MPSPAKKRKLNNDAKNSLPTRGLEYFFAKQRDQNGPNPLGNEDQPAEDAAPAAQQEHKMTDEELARKLQAEWDQEEASASSTTQQPTASDSIDYGASSTPPQVSQLENASALDGTSSEPSKPNAADTLNKGKAKGTLSLQSVAASIDTISESIPLDESPLTFDPDKYVPQLREHWAQEDGNASYALLTRCFVLVSGTSSRIKIVDTLVNCVRVLIEGDPESLLPAVSYSHVTRHSSFPLLLLDDMPKIHSSHALDAEALTTVRCGCLRTLFHLPTFP